MGNFFYFIIYSIGTIAIFILVRSLWSSYVQEKQSFDKVDVTTSKFLIRHKETALAIVGVVSAFALHGADSYSDWNKENSENNRAMKVILDDTEAILRNATTYKVGISLWAGGCRNSQLKKLLDDTNLLTGISSNFGEKTILGLPDEFLSVIRKYDHAFEQAGVQAQYGSITGRTDAIQNLIETGADYYIAQRAIIDGQKTSRSELINDIRKQSEPAIKKVRDVCSNG